MVMVVVDLLSGYAVLLPVSKKGLTGTRVAKLLMDEVILKFGCPRNLISDQDVRFTHKWWEQVMNALGIRHHLSIAYRPAGHGAVERLNKGIAD